MSNIKIDGVEIELKSCGHCNAVPTEADASKALMKAREQYKQPCPICGLAMAIRALTIEHRSRPVSAAPTWVLGSVDLWNALGLEVQHHKRYWAHEGCIDKVFRGRLERGEVWRPWCDDSIITITQ